MNCLFVGQGKQGSTSRGRFNALTEIENHKYHWTLFDTALQWEELFPFNNWLKWRHKTGPLVWILNFKLLLLLRNVKFDIIFVDKGVWISPQHLNKFRNCGGHLIHWTPDPAFVFHQSSLFEKGIGYYHLLFTTKDYELTEYKKHVGSRVKLVVQSISKSDFECIPMHRRKWDFGFLGHHEANREDVIRHLLETNRKVIVGGRGWKNFASSFRQFANFHFIGEEGLYGSAYQEFWGQCRIGLGFISQLVPDTITTRSFEIPAYHAVLCTLRTKEIGEIYGTDVLDFHQIQSDALIACNYELLESLLKKQQRKLAQMKIYHNDAMNHVMNIYETDIKNCNENSSHN